MKKWSYLILALMLIVALGSCGGGTPVDPNPGFDRLTAQLVGSDSAPLAGVSVRVGGVDTGVTTDPNGYFTLDESLFPNGPDALNDLSFGRGGFIIGTTQLVPSADPHAVISFAEGSDPGTPPTGDGSIFGHVYEATSDNTSDPPVIAGAEVTLFSIELGGVFQTTSDADGAYSFEGIAGGHWQMTAFKDGYYPEMAMIVIDEGVDLEYDFGLTPKGGISPEDGIMISGIITDSDSSTPVAGAMVSLYADTGYMGIPEPAVYDDVNSAGAPGTDARGSSMMPFYYDPQYQETTTGSDGRFEFPDPVIGYGLWLNYYADGYLNGSYYQSIDGVTDDLDLELTLDPIVPTNITGVVVDEDGNPVEGAYVEFIFAGNYGGVYPMDMAVPGGMNLEDMAADGTSVRNDVGAPPPPMTPGAEGATDGGGWDEWANSPAAGGSEDPQDSGGGVDNMLMQRFRFEHGNGHGTSAADPFTGYYSVTTGADGSFSFEDVPAGTYSVFASAYRHLSYYAEFEAQEDPAQNTLNIECPNIPVGAVEGTITDENGDPVDEALVTCTQPFVDPFTYTDANGHFLIENVPTGDWIISGYKSGFLTISEDTVISEDDTVVVNITLTAYTPPEQNTINVFGHVYDGQENSGLASVSMVFTPTDPQLGSYYRHVYSNSAGEYSTDLIAGSYTDPMEPDQRPTGEYNVLIQVSGYEDLYTRIYVDESWPEMDYWLWKIGANGNGGGGWMPGGPGGVIMPDDPPMEGGGGQTDPGDPTDPPIGL
jgi:hypothetical protein